MGGIGTDRARRTLARRHARVVLHCCDNRVLILVRLVIRPACVDVWTRLEGHAVALAELKQGCMARVGDGVCVVCVCAPGPRKPRAAARRAPARRRVSARAPSLYNRKRFDSLAILWHTLLQTFPDSLPIKALDSSAPAVASHSPCSPGGLSL